MVPHTGVIVPDYDDLPYNEEAQTRSAWGIFDKDGQKDHLGALNHLTPETKTAAAREVVAGLSFQLDWCSSELGLPAYGRKGVEHTYIDHLPTVGLVGHDDEVSFNTQSGSQWDGFLHYGHQKTRTYYNGIKHDDDVEVQKAGLGIHHWCKQGIFGRGVLIDWARWQEQRGEPAIVPVTTYGITVDDLEQVRELAGVVFRPGDILIIRTGLVKWYCDTPEPARSEGLAGPNQLGVRAGEAARRWIWNNRFAAVAGDGLTFEEFPPPSDGSMLHNWLLPHAGIPIGELWNLEELSVACARLNKWTFALASAPLNIMGGVGSPPNAIAIL
ncbi:hypothetical protein FOPE_05082 [Fonsecaea pedrosoi]|nr:hypothetical protein FOPE_05082 [Fonsecaea pedrosoi]